MYNRKNKKILTYDQALYKAAAMCSQGEKCPADIFEKVQEWGLDEAEATRLVDWLTKEKYLDERRFVHAFVNDKFVYQHWGRVKIGYALRMKNISDSLIDETMEEVIDEAQYLDICQSLIRTKIKDMPLPLSPNDKAKIFRFAAQRGFESGVISKALALCSR